MVTILLQCEVLLGFTRDQPDPPACQIDIQTDPDCEKYFVVKGCVLSFCIDVAAAQTANTVVVAHRKINKALSVLTSVTSPLYSYQVSPIAGADTIGIKVGRDQRYSETILTLSLGSYSSLIIDHIT